MLNQISIHYLCDTLYNALRILCELSTYRLTGSVEYVLSVYYPLITVYAPAVDCLARVVCVLPTDNCQCTGCGLSVSVYYVLSEDYLPEDCLCILAVPLECLREKTAAFCPSNEDQLNSKWLACAFYNGADSTGLHVKHCLAET